MFDNRQLAALLQIARTGSFEQAARALHLTQSAVSQRIRLLEERVGATLLVRGSPCRTTDLGARLCRHAETVELMELSLEAELTAVSKETARPTFKLAINADSLATWFIEAMASVEAVLFDLVLDDEGHSADWLKQGEVMAAVTARKEPVAGCNVFALGAIRYCATASPGFVSRHFPDGFTAQAAMKAPCANFNRKDHLQERFVQTVLSCDTRRPPIHWLPSTQAFVDASLAGLGWGMNPEILVREHIAAGRLVTLADGQTLDVPLYWQESRLLAPVLKPLTRAVRHIAARRLVPLPLPERAYARPERPA